MKKTWKLISGFILMFMMLMALSGAVQAVEEEFFYLNGNPVTESKTINIGEGSATWNKETSTLTLKNAIINNAVTKDLGSNHISAGIWYRGGSMGSNFTIVLEGDNKIVNIPNAIMLASKKGYKDNNLVITGDGTLTIDGVAPDGGQGSITASGLKIDKASVRINIPGMESKDLALWVLSTLSLENNASLKISAACDEAPVFLGGLNLVSGDFEVTNKKTGKECIGMSGKIKEPVNGNLVTLLGDNADDIKKQYIGSELPLTLFKEKTGYSYTHFYLKGGDLSKDAKITIDPAEFDYDGTAKTPKVVIKDQYGAELVAAVDYVVAYKDNTVPGTATVEATGKGAFTGKLTKTFTINGLAAGDKCVDANKNEYQALSADTLALTSWKKSGTASIPAAVTYNGKVLTIVEIANNAFKNNTAVTKVVIPTTVTKIGNYAFSGCTKLSTVTIGSNVTSIGKYAFYKCTKLKKIVIPNKVTSIGDFAFAYDSKLATLTLGKKVATIGKKTFYKCTALKKVTIPASVTRIGLKAFCGCSGLSRITVKTTKLKAASVGTRAFFNLPENAVVKVPESVLKSYTKLFKNKGLTKGSQTVK